MQYVSIDLETTGLDPTYCQILQLAAVFEDTEHTTADVEYLPTFNCYLNHTKIIGQPYALQMSQNHKILRCLTGEEKTNVPIFDREEKMWVRFAEWLRGLGIDDRHKTNIAGKNFAMFDNKFIPEWIMKNFRHRVIDVGNLYIDFDEKMLPNSDFLAKTILKKEVSHDALEDARDVVRLIRIKKEKG